MEQVFEFLNELSRNNNREWFTENKSKYQESLDQFRNLASDLIEGISTFDPTMDGVDARQAIFRIYKDVRFSKDKLPYKTHFGCWMTKGGRKSSDAGYYFHLEPGKSFIAAGVHSPAAEQLRTIRQEIMFNPEAYLEVIGKLEKQKKYERGGREDMLKRGPAGFPQDFPYIDELKYKHHIFTRNYKDAELTGKKASTLLKEDFHGLYPLVFYLNQALSFTGNF